MNIQVTRKVINALPSKCFDSQVYKRLVLRHLPHALVSDLFHNPASK